MTIKYFAWLRERIGLAEEQLVIPSDVTSIAELISWLSTQNENYAYAFENPKLIRAALDKKHVSHETSLKGHVEIALFPPMTGG